MSDLRQAVTFWSLSKLEVQADSSLPTSDNPPAPQQCGSAKANSPSMVMDVSRTSRFGRCHRVRVEDSISELTLGTFGRGQPRLAWIPLSMSQLQGL